MKNKVRCKACGFVMDEGAYHECPACGVPEKMFEPYSDKVPESRRKILDLHIHPVIVHAPQALGFITLGLAVLLAIIVQIHQFPAIIIMFVDSIQVLSILLPLTTIGAICSGVIDGKYRYKRLDTILLKRKMIFGSLFLLLSAGMAVLAFVPGFDTSLALQICYIVINLACFGCSAFLGLWGAALNQAIMPGPMPERKKAQSPASQTEGK